MRRFNAFTICCCNVNERALLVLHNLVILLNEKPNPNPNANEIVWCAQQLVLQTLKLTNLFQIKFQTRKKRRRITNIV